MENNFNRSSFIKRSKGRIEDKYVIEKKIGEGSYGNVFLCKKKLTSEKFAVKSILKKQMSLKTLNSEINTLMLCDHPNIIKIFEIFEDKGTCHIVMENCKGGELFEYILEKKKIAESEAVLLFKQIMTAINYLHSNHIVHRDLKPENLMFSDDHFLKLIDFGIAKKVKNSETMTTRLGTPFYISPEVLIGEYSISTDIWSAGVILYVMLCGYPPFYADSDNEIFKKVLIGNYSLKGKEWRDVSSGAKDLIKNMLVVNTENRLNSENVLKHPWIRGSESVISMSLKSEEILAFNNSSELRKMLLFCIACCLSDEVISKFRDQFLALDMENKGRISVDDFQNNLKKIVDFDMALIDNFAKCVDLNCNRSIEYTEFISAMIGNGCLDKNAIMVSFGVLDLNQDGKICKNDFNKFFSKSNKKNKKTFEGLLKGAGILDTDSIYAEKFLNIITNY